MSTLLAVTSTDPKSLILAFIAAVLVIGGIAGLIWCIDKWIHPVPPPVRLFIAVVLVVLIIVWAVMNFL